MERRTIAVDTVNGQVRARWDWPSEIDITESFLVDTDPRYVTVTPHTVDFSLDNGCASYQLVRRNPVCSISTWRRIVGIYREAD